MQQKDVIYIDVEDDITAIIGKVKSAKQKIVAIVPPKRTGVLQSAVNLRLLARAADGADKKLVLITGNQALTHLAANAKIPIAKNLQSKPELAELKSFDDDDDEEDVIEGDKLPVGDHAKMSSSEEEDVIIPPASVDGIDIDDKPKKERGAAAKKPKSGIKVPDFGTFRKKMVLAVIGGILLIVFLVWAIFIAPHATIVISAKTSPVDIKTQLTVGDALSNDPDKATLASTTQTEKTSPSTDVTPTGTKDVGTKASGTVTFSNCQDNSSLTVNAGTYISSGGNNYVVQSTVVVPGGSGNFVSGCTSAGTSAPVQVTATDIGSDYNTAAGASFTVAGFSSKMSATSSSGITGGDKHTAKVTTAEDVQNALNTLKQQNTDAEKKKLAAKFESGTKVISDSFNATTGDPKVTPGIGEEVSSGNAKLTVDITYTLVGVEQSALDSYLKSAISKQVDTDDQRIYETGASKATLTNYEPAEDQKTATVQLSAEGQVGPKIDDNQIKEDEKGKRAGEVQGDLRRIEGVSDVSVKLSPFWVGGVPDDVNKITVQFKLLND